MRRPLLGLLAVICLSTSAAAQDDWPRFRGPNADGVAPDNAALPTKWNNTDNVAWAADVPGWGWSCPIVWGDRIFVTTVISDEKNLTPSKGLYLGQGVRTPAKGIHHWVVCCFDLNTGKELWKHEAHTGQPKVPRHPKSTYASETPTTDGERLYALFGDLGLYCYGLDGKPLWSQEIEPRKTVLDYGAAASPVVHDGQVIVVYDNLKGSWIAAFDAKTGDERWRKPRDETHSWATPFVWTNEVRTEIVVPGKKRNRSYSLDGKLLWEFDGKMSNLVIPSPFAAHGLCYIASGYVGDPHRPTFAVRPGASGDIAPDGDFKNAEFIAWYQGRSSSYNPSQIVYGDHLYTLFDRGFLTCHDAKTGEEVYDKRRFTPLGSFTASPFAYNGHLFFLSEDGLTYVVKAGPEFEIVERNDLDELCISSPAVAGDKLLIRTASKLYCLTEGAKLDAAASARLKPRRRASSAIDIWSATARGNREKVTQLLTSGVSVNARQAGSGSTPLNSAAVFGQTGIAKVLIEKGADVSIANKDGNTALHIASFFAHVEFVELLLEEGASVSIKSGRGETPLDVVSADWSPQLEGIYKSIGNLVGTELDLARIKQTRPKIAKLLREHAAKDAGRESGSAVPRGPSNRSLRAQTFSELKPTNWHQWRGPEANGVSRTATPPIEWSEGENIRWKMPIDGNGSSTPIIWDNKVFLLTAIDTGKVDPSLPKPEDQPERVFGIKYPNTTYRFAVLCLDRKTGKELWRRTATERIPHEGHHGDNDFASASPTTDGERLYCWFGSAGLFCYDLDGNRLWDRDLGKAYMGASLGEGCSPVVHDGRLVIVRDQQRQSAIEVLDARTGEMRWKADREEPNAWATPMILHHSGKTQVVTAASNMVRSYDLSDGEIIWQCSGLTGNVIPSPVVDGDVVYCMSGYQGCALLALPLSATGDISSSDAIVWTRSRGTPYVPSPLLYDGKLYFSQSNQAILSCLDSKTGDEIMDRTRLSGISRIYASPVGARGRVYITGRNGTTLVLQRSEELKMLATNKLDDQFDASPALAGNQLFLRGSNFLYCIVDGDLAE